MSLATVSRKWYVPNAYNVVLYTLLVLLVGMTVLPLVYSFITSFRPTETIFQSITWVPETIVLNPYERALASLGNNLKNSLLVSLGTAAITLIITVPGAYAFARKDFPGKKVAFYIILLSFMFPHLLLIIPISDLWRSLGLYNTIPGLWLAYQLFVTPWGIWVLRDYFESLPINLEEAARVYGCTEVSAIYRVIIPLSLPVIMAVGFLAFLQAWNDFLFANLLTTGLGPRPAVVQLYVTIFSTESIPWNLLMAYTFIVSAPPAVLFLISRRYISEAFS